MVATNKAENDPNFSKSVIYMFYNGIWGAQGIIINYPLSDELAKKVKTSEEMESYSLFKGGPVTFPSYKIIALDIPSKASRWRTQPLTVVEYNSYKIYRDSTEEAVQKGKQPNEGIRLPLYFGFSGWNTGQLEAEIRRGVWRVLNCDDIDFPDIRTEDLWKHLSGDLQMTSCTSKNW